MKSRLLFLAAVCVAGAAVTGCAERRYQPTPDSGPVPTYKYQPPPASVPAPVPSPAPTAGAAAATPATNGAPAAGAGQPEAIPPSPGPEYVWMPGYWATGVSGGWEWIGGHYVGRQAASDEQLRAARGMLEQARIGLTGDSLKSVNEAIDEINNALKAR